LIESTLIRRDVSILFVLDILSRILEELHVQITAQPMASELSSPTSFKHHSGMARNHGQQLHHHQPLSVSALAWSATNIDWLGLAISIKRTAIATTTG
jgi:hypothetical protein